MKPHTVFLMFAAGAILGPQQSVGQADPPEMFEASSTCISCHNGLTTPNGADVSIGADWRNSMMANAARDPYWHAAVRRETIDHPPASAVIEKECSTCHMPMAHFQMTLEGGQPDVFSHLPIQKEIAQTDRMSLLAADGVACATCHQIAPEKLGDRETFVGRFLVDKEMPLGQRSVYGPFEVDPGRTRIMASATGFLPSRGSHIQESALCASCHTLITHAMNEQHEVVGELPEQVPYLEWLHSDYAKEKSCQNCHMPEVPDSISVSSVLGKPRANVNTHVFRGGNFLVQRMFATFGKQLGVETTSRELQNAVNRTVEHLETRAASVAIHDLTLSDDRLKATVEIVNRAGHKLPTAYPSRRVWLQFRVVDAMGDVVFESGALQDDGSIAGNDNDLREGTFEPHYTVLSTPDQVQIYEAIMAGPDGTVTTGITTGLRYVKDNRIVPRGFDKGTAEVEIAVQGSARSDADFEAGSDRVRIDVDLPSDKGPYEVEAKLWYQPIGYRWAANLKDYDAMETRRFAEFYDALSSESAVLLARDVREVRLE